MNALGRGGSVEYEGDRSRGSASKNDGKLVGHGDSRQKVCGRGVYRHVWLLQVVWASAARG